MTMGQHWLGKTKPKQALSLTQNAFKKLLWNFKKKTEFSTACLPACLQTRITRQWLRLWT